jgi:hypothetical protein
MQSPHPRNLEKRLLLDARGLSARRVAEKLGITKGYAEKLLCGELTCDRRLHQIEVLVGKPIWSSREDWELVQLWHRDLPSLVFATKGKLRAACRAAGLKHLSRPGPTRFQMLKSLHEESTRQTTI